MRLARLTPGMRTRAAVELRARVTEGRRGVAGARVTLAGALAGRALHLGSAVVARASILCSAAVGQGMEACTARRAGAIGLLGRQLE